MIVALVLCCVLAALLLGTAIASGNFGWAAAVLVWLVSNGAMALHLAGFLS